MSVDVLFNSPHIMFGDLSGYNLWVGLEELAPTDDSSTDFLFISPVSLSISDSILYCWCGYIIIGIHMCNIQLQKLLNMGWESINVCRLFSSCCLCIGMLACKFSAFCWYV